MSANAGAQTTLLADLKRMLPVWTIVVATAILVVFSMKYLSINFLENALTANRSGCDYAALYVTAGRKKLERILPEAAAIRLQADDLTQSSLGILRDNPNLQRARADFERALELCAIDQEAHAWLSTLNWYAGDAAAAYYHAGAQQRRMGTPREALASYQMALEHDPEHLPALIGLAVAYREIGDIDEALVTVAGKEELLAATPSGQIALGMVYGRAGRTREAEELLKQGLLSQPTNLPALRELARLLEGRRANREAAEYFYTLASGDIPSTVEAAHIAAINYAIAGDIEMEERALRLALRYFPNSVNLNFDLAMNLHRQGKRNAARDTLNRAMEIDSATVLQRIETAGIRPGT